MHKDYESKYHRLEENYWWFTARRDILFRLIDRLNIKRDDNILEVGCSGCSFIEVLRKKGFEDVCGVDISKDAIGICRKRGITAYAMDAAKTKFKDNQFDVIISSDILEHIKDDDSALKEWNRILKRNGIMIIFVPAFSFLWSYHDAINKHYRRYSKQSLTKALKKENFEVIRASYWNFSLFLPVALSRILNKKGNGKDQLYDINPIINKFFISLLKFENRILGYMNFPFGISVFAVARKK
jgi:ubiquinone/menaquinone biosynthesis C-methylase UbiE